MELRQYKLLTFEQNFMKLKFLIPFYIVLMSITFCSRKSSDEKEKSSKQPSALRATSADDMTGTVVLDTATNRIFADLWLNVSNADFKYANDFMQIQTTGNYKGITFRYFDTVNNKPDSGLDSIPMHVVFNFANNKNWRINDSIRLMSLNEEQNSTFVGLKPYFEKRIEHFQNNNVSFSDLVAFNNQWNEDNPKNPVVTATDSVQPSRILRFIPRLTKDGTIVSLKLKQ